MEVHRRLLKNRVLILVKCLRTINVNNFLWYKKNNFEIFIGQIAVHRRVLKITCIESFTNIIF